MAKKIECCEEVIYHIICFLLHKTDLAFQGYSLVVFIKFFSEPCNILTDLNNTYFLFLFVSVYIIVMCLQGRFL